MTVPPTTNRPVVTSVYAAEAEAEADAVKVDAEAVEAGTTTEAVKANGNIKLVATHMANPTRSTKDMANALMMNATARRRYVQQLDFSTNILNHASPRRSSALRKEWKR